jgi:hypothetical protein
MFDGAIVGVTTALATVVCAGFWCVLPLLRRARITGKL